MRVHLIGHLQSNKAPRAVELFDGIDSLDSLRLAERLNESAGRLGKRLPVLIEVKLSSEETKAGLEPDSAGAAELLERLPELHHLKLRGLMTIASVRCFRSRDAGLLSQLARVARPLGRGAPEFGVWRALDGHERRLFSGYCRGRYAHSRGHGALWRAQSRDGAGLMLRSTAAGVTLAVRAQPGAKKTAITGVYGEGAAAQLKIAVHAPPLEGRANAALLSFLAELSGLPRNRVEILSGELNRSKVFLLRGLTRQDAERLFEPYFHIS